MIVISCVREEGRIWRAECDENLFVVLSERWAAAYQFEDRRG
jgi:hypothetical protein